MTSRARRREAGFTLIELLIAISIAGLFIAMIAMHGKPRSAGLEENGTASELAGGLREARAQAIVQNKPVALTLDIANHRWKIDNQPFRRVPPQFRMDVLTVQGEARGNLAAIVFEPDGSSTGGQVAFDDGLRKFAVNIDWLTGMVRVTKE
ncbi:MAG TPA: GspH/FimT family pseudopilin [Alphaproteobacteria bacterium]|nr:GspH/FimT family pseudopilin [Alphaproteobacteria bacterium]